MTKYGKYFIPLYKRHEHNIIGANGSFLYTKDKKYLDMVSGLGVNILGYNNSAVNAAIKEQTEKFTHLSNYFESGSAGELAKYIADNSFTKKVFFSNSGTEAAEAGLKIIRKYSAEMQKPDIITFTNAFHGRTLGSALITEPGAPSGYRMRNSLNILTLEYNNCDELDKINERTAGVFVEVVQGQGGINVADLEFVKKLKQKTTEHNCILLTDEIQSGVGRTGKLFAYEHYGIVPDLCIIAKGIGGGLPLGALLANEKFGDYLSPGEHGSTFGGNPVSCAAGLATIRQVNRKDFLNDVFVKGRKLTEGIKDLRSVHPDKIGRISGIGLMIGVELLKGKRKVIDLFEKEGVFVNITHGNVLRLLPPLIISHEEICIFTDTFGKVLKFL